MRHAACFAMLALTACGRPSAVPAPVVPTTSRISPSATRYLVTEHRRVEQVLRGQPIVTDATTRVVMTVVLDSAAQGFLLDARVDSAEVAGDAGFSGNVAPGARFVGRLSKGGIVLELTPPANGTDLLEQIALGLHDLVPHLPPEGASAGTTWHDTTTVRGLTAGMPTIHASA